MVQTEITDFDIEFCETEDSLIIAMPKGHGYNDKDLFFNDMFECLNNMGFDLNGYEKTDLYIQSDDRFYIGAFACNTFVQNSILDIYIKGYGVLDLITDRDEIQDIIKDWF